MYFLILVDITGLYGVREREREIWWLKVFLVSWKNVFTVSIFPAWFQGISLIFLFLKKHDYFLCQVNFNFKELLQRFLS